MSGASLVNGAKSESKANAASKRPTRILVAASGSGGHLIPALHIMRAIKSIEPTAVVEFIGAGRPLEDKIIVGAGFTRHLIAAAGVKGKSPLALLKLAFVLPKGVFQSFRLFRRFRPDVVVGVGGYVSVLPIVLARLMRIATWAHEAELHPGLANRFLGYFADTISTAFSETRIRGRAKIVYIGHPVRSELREVERNPAGRDIPTRLLVLGGSQGARSLDNAVTGLGDLLCERDVEVVHQCRPDNSEVVINAYRATKVKASVVPFIDDMAGAYQWSDIIISRSGAGSVAEISCVNRPTIFVPYPFQQGTHQSDNAKTLAKINKAVVVEETQPDFPRRLREALTELLKPEVFSAMKMAPSEPRGLDAAEVIARGILGG
jgi:UDP-N-acetylglucosamine--N-acetylmuramyl-(pentapeptide) pyrophosphoryl-undecaprenol N-acetylglucosamine transferase